MRTALVQAALLAGIFASPALAAGDPNATVRVTEFMQTGTAGGNREFFELTNLGTAAVDISGWSYNDDNPNSPVLFSTLGVGSLAAGQSVVFTELTADAFRSYWNLPSTALVFSYGGNSNLSSGGDQINIYNSATQSTATLIDGITFGAGTNGVSKNRPVGGTGNVDGASYVLSVAGDAFGSHLAGGAGTDLGNPGFYPSATPAVPEAATWAMMIAGFGLTGGALRRRRAIAFA
jgi:hypothetical protein